MKTIMIALACIAAIGCSSQPKESQEIGAYQADPDKVPKDIVLNASEPLVSLRFKVDADGYTMQAFRSVGAPSSSIVQNRDVVIQALDNQGNALGSISVVNPREVRTAGSDKPATAALATAEFIVSFAAPDRIASIQVTVVRGPNEGFKQTFEVGRDLPQLR